MGATGVKTTLIKFCADTLPLGPRRTAALIVFRRCHLEAVDTTYTSSQTDKQTDRQADKQSDRQADKQSDREADKHGYLSPPINDVRAHLEGLHSVRREPLGRDVLPSLLRMVVYHHCVGRAVEVHHRHVLEARGKFELGGPGEVPGHH